MRDWSRVQIEQQQQQHQYVLPPEFQQILSAPRNLRSGAGGGRGHFLEPMSPPPPPQHFPQYFHGSDPLKHLLPASDRGEGDDRGEECEEEVWSEEELRSLIRIRRDLDSGFRNLSSPQLHLWDEVSRRLGTMGFIRNGRNCKEKFEGLCKHYKRTREAGGRPERFMEELDAFYGLNNNNNNSVLTICANKVKNDGNQVHRAVDDQSPEINVLATAAAEAAAAALMSEPDGGSADQIRESQQQQQGHDVNSSSESSAEYDEPSDEEKKARSLRRRKSWKSRMVVLENMVRRFVENQEQMQQKFLELLDKREQERSKRDEVWRKQEVARMSREYELRVEEQARRINYDAAMSSALQKATGNNNTLANNNNNSNVELSQGGPVPSPYSNNTLGESNDDQQLVTHQQPVNQGCDSMNKRWPKTEVQALIQLRAGMETRFQEVGPKGPFWEEISAGLACQGYVRSAKRCKEKWENINKYYRKTSNKKRPENTKTCPYFQELDSLYRKGIIKGGGVSMALINASSSGVLVNNNNSSKVEETTDENREESGSREAEAEVLSIMPSSNVNRTGGVFGNGERCCAHNTESPGCGGAEKGHLQQQQQQQQQLMSMSLSKMKQKRSWAECEAGGGLGLSFEALQQGAAELMMCSNKSLKFDQLVGSSHQHQHHHHQQQQQMDQMNEIQQQQQQQEDEMNERGNRELMIERQSQEFQEVESSATNLVDGFGIVRARV